MSAPVTPLPAATLVLLRNGANGLEVLLLRRSPHAGFAPGAYVFPGGVVDADDAAPEVLTRVDGLTAERAAARLDLVGASPPALAYYVAASREAFEETGILLGSPVVDVEGVRADLLEGRIGFAEALDRLDARVDAERMEYCAHWITPERSPRRYDTRFFAAAATSVGECVVDGREMTDSIWVGPAAAADMHARGTLPMMLPTLRTLEGLAAFSDARTALAALSNRPVPTILPHPDARGFAGSGPQARLPTS